ncbi:hypothetical protein GCM10010954_34520 [Halobacillus andaensis]|uniref:Thioredoxin domain-containing protein n=1 Tax=Halobacillus andaensis TaxID=1176239 RepID=A0A917F152_HALAA|nr:TlpA disulfide reductase family protein [Halobacillus andaensis]MBP2005559.1 thiol-disulfide isomerase/thioredoxin [Halobacillus andaensis]GGF32417.1 hypothetical protein GCM10010954_34520 [Halobacillus andaensis]
MKKAPDFNLATIQADKSYQLKDDLGKVVVLTFWTSWCPDCQRDLPKKEHLYQTMNKDKVSMITINVKGRERNFEEAINYFNKHITQPTLVDEDVDTYLKYNAEGVPTTVIIDQDGFIIDQFNDQADFLEIVESIGKAI